MKRKILMLSVMIAIAGVCYGNELMVTLPVNGLAGDAMVPMDTGEVQAANDDDNRYSYSVVWGGLYGIHPAKPWTKRNKGSGGHPGMDIRVNTGTDVRAIANGIIMNAGPNGSWGNVVVVKHTNPADGAYYWSIYAHLSHVAVDVGKTVTKGEYIGKSGNSGMSTNPHLHFQIDRFYDITNKIYWPKIGEDNYQIDDENVDLEAFFNMVRNNTIDPIAFSVGVGHFPDGYHYLGISTWENRSDWVMETYRRYQPWLGNPTDNGGSIFVHTLPREPWLPALWAQDFDIGMIVCNDQEQKAYSIVKGFCWVYRGGSYENPDGTVVELWGPNELGAPKSNEVFEYHTNLLLNTYSAKINAFLGSDWLTI